MSMKRQFSNMDDDAEAQSASARGNGFNPKRQKQFGTGKHKAKEGSMEYSRKRARNIQRLLQRKKDLPANVQNDLQRELETHKSTVSDKSFQRKRSAMISKYHMVRFFERKKASRLAKQIKRQIEQNPDSDEVESLKRQLHIAEVDEAYSINYPHIEPYISLYGNAKAEGNSQEEGEEEAEDDNLKQTPIAKAALDAERPPMWSVIEKAMEEGPEALRQLRERRSADVSPPVHKKNRGPVAKAAPAKADSKQQPQRPQKAQKPQEQQNQMAKGKPAKPNGEQPPLNRRERRRLMREAMPDDKSDDDDGGFFEEV